MFIEKIELFNVCNPCKIAYKTSFGVNNAFDSVVVKMTSGDYTGWGEAASGGFPGFSSECAETAFIVAKKFLIPEILKKDIKSGQELQDLLKIYRGNQFSKAAFDMAWWNLYSQMQNKPFYKVIGGIRDEVLAGTAIGVLDCLDLLMEKIDELINSGYPRIKLKYCPGWGLKMLAAVRSHFPDIVFHIDCNAAYTLSDIDMFKKLDKYNLAMIEQPLGHDDLIDHAELQSKIATPLCLDESITSPEIARKAVKIGACKFVNIKHGRVGGITNALKINEICADANIPCWVGGMGESSLGVNVGMSLATLPNMGYPSDITPSGKFYKNDLCIPISDNPRPGIFRPRQVPGIGSVPDIKVLKKTTLRKFSTVKKSRLKNKHREMLTVSIS